MCVVCVCVYEQVCVCCLNLVINYVLQKSFRHIEFQRSLIMMMSCIMDVDVDTGISTPLQLLLQLRAGSGAVLV